MRKYLLAAAAAAAIAAPAAAQSVGPYAGIEGGILFPKDTTVDFDDDVTPVNDAFDIKYKNGYDIDAVAGYDLGMFRVEGELGYKRAKIDEIRDITGDTFDADGKARVLSGMINGLVDFDAGGARVYGGGGFGRAGVKFSNDGDSDSDSAWAYQLIAGVAVPVASNVEAGLKYRYFRTGKLNFESDDTFGGDLSGRFKSHSVLASVLFNFGRPTANVIVPVAAPAPAPVAPATQVCPDGSVVLATDVCAVAPPPPPAPVYQQGERG